MNRRLITFSAAVLLTAAVAFSASAQATRTWVSGVGDDANPCSRTAPCKTFAGAISKTAAGGEINVIDPGGFGAVTITKSITIDGRGAEASILASLTNGVIINAAATDVVTLRNLQINGAGNGLNGVRVLKARAVHLQNVDIFGFRGSPGHGVAVNHALGTDVTALFVRECTMTNNAGGGIVVAPSAVGAKSTVVVEHSSLDQNAFGVFAGEGSVFSIAKSEIGGNGSAGLTIFGSSGVPAQVNIIDTTISGNAVGISTTGSPVVRMGSSRLLNNTTGITGNAVSTFGDNYIAGNGGLFGFAVPTLTKQ